MRKSRQRPVPMRQAAVPSPSALHEVYMSDAATLSRSKSRIHMILHDESPISRQTEHTDLEQPPTSAHTCLPEICEMAEKLKVQVADLSLFLEEERLLHKDTKRRAAEILKDKIFTLQNDHKAATRRQQTEYEADMEALKAQHHYQLVNERLEFNSTIAKLKTELEIMSGAFHTFKSQTEINRKTELKEWEAKITSAMKIEKENEKRDIENLLNYEHNQEIHRIEQKHQAKLAEVKVEYKKQAETLKKRFVNHEDDLLELSVLREKLESTSAELATATEQARVCEQELFDTKMKYSDSKTLLMSNETHIDERIKEIEVRYKQQHDNLLEANTTLRLQYLKKCEELFELNASLNVDSIQKADDVMARAKAKRQYRLKRSQSLLDSAQLTARGYTKSLFTQLHVQNLNQNLDWWLEYIKHRTEYHVYPLPVLKVYNEKLRKNMTKARVKKPKFPPLPTCHVSRNLSLQLKRK